MGKAKDDCCLVTDFIDGRREILGWVRKGDLLSEGRDILHLYEKTGAQQVEPVTFDCQYGWLPECLRDALLTDAPVRETAEGQGVDWRLRTAREVLEAAERYRAQQLERQERELAADNSN